MRMLLTTALLLVWATPAAAEPATRSDKAQILAWAKAFFPDPHSLRSTEVSDRAVVRGTQVVCIAFNGKNSYGAYVGVQRHPFEVRGEILVPAERSYSVDSGTCHQPQIVMRSFPELANIK